MLQHNIAIRNRILYKQITSIRIMLLGDLEDKNA